MPRPPTTTWIRLPDHLGDTVLATPALAALGRLGPCWTAGPAPCAAVARAVLGAPPGPCPDRVDQVVLLKPALRAVFEGPRCGRRIGLATDHRWPWLDRAVVPQGAHRQQDLDAVAAAAGAAPAGAPRLPPGWAGPAPAAPPPGLVLLLPLSATGATVDWPGHRPLADRLAAAGHRPVFAAGPGQDGELAALAGPHRCLPALPLAALAAWMLAAAAVVGNDSGLTHLAAAVRRGAGRPPATVIGVAGSTDPARTGAPGARWLRAPAPPCWPCYRGRCPHQRGCLDLPVGPVAAAVQDALGAAA